MIDAFEFQRDALLKYVWSYLYLNLIIFFASIYIYIYMMTQIWRVLVTTVVICEFWFDLNFMSLEVYLKIL